ncbi:MAG: DUF2958 domain-containing protein [Rhodospirillaceae bacterium]|nr:DUF2958 domain-containing protein [Rhodospirillaceae bacterium]
MKVQLMTKALENSLPALYATDGNKEKDIVIKYFTPDSSWTWYVFEGEKQENGDFLFFGLVEGFESEMGYFTLSELEAARGPLGLPIERDRHYMAVYDTATRKIK